MTITPTHTAGFALDPILLALSYNEPVGVEVLEAAIDYREGLLDQITSEIAILQVRRKRLLDRK